MWILPALTLCFLLELTEQSDMNEAFFHVHKSHCFSCASFAYLPLWQKLMHHYYPPKNFTDRCWQPDNGIGVVPCTSACFTLVERIDQHDLFTEQRGVMRGCMDRLLLFGLDDDVKNVLSSYNSQRVCRQTDRKILRLFPLSSESDVVTLCSCVGDFCNEQDMLVALNVTPQTILTMVTAITLALTFL